MAAQLERQAAAAVTEAAEEAAEEVEEFAVSWRAPLQGRLSFECRLGAAGRRCSIALQALLQWASAVRAAVKSTGFEAAAAAAAALPAAIPAPPPPAAQATVANAACLLLPVCSPLRSWRRWESTVATSRRPRMRVGCAWAAAAAAACTCLHPRAVFP